MRIGILLLALAATPGLAETPKSYSEANKLWERSKEMAQYQTYSEEFAQFNNRFRLDEKDGCYGLDVKPVTLLLVITHDGRGKFAKVEQIFTSVDNAKAQCFKKTYRGIETKIPPFLPFVLQMDMG